MKNNLVVVHNYGKMSCQCFENRKLMILSVRHKSLIHDLRENLCLKQCTNILLLEIQLNHHLAQFYNKCKSQESHLEQTIMKVTSSNTLYVSCG